MSEISETASPMSTREVISIEPSTGGTSSDELPGMHQSYRLDGENYLQWSQLVRTFLKGRGKISHLTRLAPKASDPTFIAWDVEDSMLMSWLWSSMQPEVSKNYMFLSTTKDIWETVKRTYSNVQDASIVMRLRPKLVVENKGL